MVGHGWKLEMVGNEGLVTKKTKVAIPQIIQIVIWQCVKTQGTPVVHIKI